MARRGDGNVRLLSFPRETVLGSDVWEARVRAALQRSAARSGHVDVIVVASGGTSYFSLSFHRRRAGGMIAAIYARKSNPQEGAAGTSESVDRQIAHVRLCAARQDWTVDESSVYFDDNVSGDRRAG